MRRSSALILTLLAVAGCGGSGSSGNGPVTPNARGTATMNVVWPERGREIPIAANGLKVTLSQGSTVVGTATIARPATGTTQTSTAFGDLPVGTLNVAVAAYPNADGSGVAQATGAGTMAVAVDAPGTVTVSLVSTIASLAISTSSNRLGKGTTSAIAASALDASGNIVLLAAGGTEPIVWTSTATAVAAVNGTGPTASLSCLTAGTTTIRATFVKDDAGDTVTATKDLTVVPGSGTVTIQ